MLITACPLKITVSTGKLWESFIRLLNDYIAIPYCNLVTTVIISRERLLKLSNAIILFSDFLADDSTAHSRLIQNTTFVSLSVTMYIVAKQCTIG